MSIPWKFYAGRRRVTVESVLRDASIDNYSDLVLHLKQLGVKAPPLNEVSHLFNKKAAQKMHLPDEQDAKAESVTEAKELPTDESKEVKTVKKTRRRRTNRTKKEE